MKKLNYWSHAECTQIIKENKDDTAYFSRSVTMDEMWKMFRYDLNFGEAETAVIIASLIKAGAKFKQVPTNEFNKDTINHIKSMIK